mmetsp:Transcript_20052/g.67831  ORF Transcript_20052/g.67831 Transcript_20052/m.67831 type:complete len:231 (-) Transcript_20052:758-1450(-)
MAVLAGSAKVRRKDGHPGADSSPAPALPAPQLLWQLRTLSVKTRDCALVALAVQASFQIVSMAAARRPHQPRFLASAAVVSAEALKIGVSVAILLREQVRGGEAALPVLWRQVVVDWRGTLALFPPALIYLVQNNLLYLAAAHLDAAAYQVLYQLKLLTAALFSVLLLGRRLSPRRWGALLVLFVGALPRCSAQRTRALSTPREHACRCGAPLYSLPSIPALTRVCPWRR